MRDQITADQHRLTRSLMLVTRIALTIAMVAGAFALVPTPQADAHTRGLVRIGAPASGKWADFNTEPWRHWAPNGGDWALDFHARAGTSIKANLSGPVPYANPTLTVKDVTNGCGAGKRVRINVHQNGTYVGWVSYSHLANVTVKRGDRIQIGQTIGKTHKWTYRTNCWEVRTAAGVHTHIEAYNAHHYSCYKNRSGGSQVSSNSFLGYLGGTRTSSGAC